MPFTRAALLRELPVNVLSFTTATFVVLGNIIPSWMSVPHLSPQSPISAESAYKWSSNCSCSNRLIIALNASRPAWTSLRRVLWTIGSNFFLKQQRTPSFLNLYRSVLTFILNIAATWPCVNPIPWMRRNSNNSFGSLDGRRGTFTSPRTLCRSRSPESWSTSCEEEGGGGGGSRGRDPGGEKGGGESPGGESPAGPAPGSSWSRSSRYVWTKYL